MPQKEYVPQKVAANLGKLYTEGWDALWEAGERIQAAVLAEILEAAKGCDYAKDHGFDGLSPEAFLERAAISTYDDYRPYIQRNMRTNGHELTQLPLVYYLISSGSGGENKYFPETDVAAVARQTSIDLWNMIVSQIEPAMTSPDAKMLAVVNTAPIDAAPNGLPVRRASAQSAKPLWEHFPDKYVHPYEFFEVECSEEDRNYLLALYVLRERRFNLMFCNNLGYFGVLLDAIDENAARMIEDVRTGGVSIALSKADQELLAPSLAPDPARADELAALLAGDGRLIPAKAWPHLECVSTWLAGTVGAYAVDVRHRLPQNARYLNEVYGTSEGMFGAPIAHDAAGGMLDAFSCYFEFLPLDAPGESARLLSMGEVEVGKYYELVVTTYSGLYRYNIHDIVRIDGFKGSTANVAFCCRGDNYLEFSGNKFYAMHLFDAMGRACESAGGVPRLYQMANGAETTGADGLDLLVEWHVRPESMEAFRAAWQTEVEAAGIPCGRIYTMRDGWRRAEYAARKQDGRTEQTIKLAPIAQRLPEGFVESAL